MSIKLDAWDKEWLIGFEIEHYHYGGGLAILMYCFEDNYWQSYATLTVNLEDFPTKGDNAFVDSNNLGEGIIDWIIENDIGELTGRWGYSGYCQYPEVKFNLDKIKEHEVK